MQYTDVLGSQFTWIACDKNGYIGAFNIAGNGKVPQQVFLTTNELIYETENLIFEGKLICNAIQCHSSFDEEFADISKRGIFCFDWTPIYHRKDDAYEKICEPTAPISIYNLPKQLKNYISSICFSTVSFKDINKIDIKNYFKIG